MVDADVLILTEIFSIVAAHHMVTGLQKRWPHIMRPLGNTLGTDGGVLIASRWPITQSYAMRFRDSVGNDRLAAKGVVAVVMHKPRHNPVVIAGVHMQAGTDETTSAVRLRQWQDVQWFLHHFLAAAARGLPRFIAGDFNEDMNASPRPNHFHLCPVRPPVRDGFTFDLDANTIAAARAEEGDYTAMLDGILIDQTTAHAHRAVSHVVYPRTRSGAAFTDHEALVAVIHSRFLRNTK